MRAGRFLESTFVSPKEILWSGLAVGSEDSEELDAENEDDEEEVEINGDFEGIECERLRLQREDDLSLIHI